VKIKNELRGGTKRVSDAFRPRKGTLPRGVALAQRVLVVLPVTPMIEPSVEMIPLREIERRYVLQVLEQCGGNRTEAARVLGLDRKTLYRKLLKWGAAG
jgi:DNA-binding NtrC family response regulator